jgi:peptidoglycan/xylan/chitin deacetylase (PgdA/CDA1 family)
MPLQDLKYLLARYSGIPAFINILMKNRPLVVTYHGIYDGPRNTGSLPATFVHVDDMIDQLNFIRGKYRIIEPDNLQEALETGNPLPPHSALITFDDGYENFARLAYPVLQSMGIIPIVFTATEYIEEEKPFWFDLVWSLFHHVETDLLQHLVRDFHLEHGEYLITDLSFLGAMKGMKPTERHQVVSAITSACMPELKEKLRIFYSMNAGQIRNLSKGGVIFGGHTHTHTILTALSKDEAEGEIYLNKEKIEGLTQKPCAFFAYPNGGKGDFNHFHKDILKSAGYEGAFSLTHERTSFQDDPMEISRIHVAPEDTIKSLDFRFSGIYTLLRS